VSVQDPLDSASSQRSLITPSVSPASAMRRLLCVLTAFVPSPNAKFHHPSSRSQEHDCDCNPSDCEVLHTFIRIYANLVSVLVDDMGGFLLNDCDDDGCDQKGEETDGSETPVSEGDKS
jgi:hypothetical protein